MNDDISHQAEVFGELQVGRKLQKQPCGILCMVIPPIMAGRRPMH